MDFATLFALFITFLKVGSVMFGGAYAIVPILEHEVVVKKGWLSEKEFADMIAATALIPGPVSVRAAAYVGYKIGGVLGTLVSTVAVVLPAFVLILIVATVLTEFYQHVITRSILFGVSAAVIGLIAAALVTVSRGVLRELDTFQSVVTAVIAVTVFIAIVKFGVDPVILILVSAVIGLVLGLAGFIS